MSFIESDTTGVTAATALVQSIEQKREAIVQLCAQLVAARSVNPPGDTREVATVFAAALRRQGIACRYEYSDPVMPSVVAEIDSGRPGRHLVWNVHLDTMPAGDEAVWSVPPYHLTRRDGRLYGLGMGNMKGSVAAVVYAAALMREQRERWKGRVTVTAVSDEVVFGEHGAAYLLRQLPELAAADGMLCGEGPGFKRLAIGEKGVLWLRLSATGTSGHASSVVTGNSATARLAEVVHRVDRLNGLRSDVPHELRGMFAHDDPGFTLSMNVGTVHAGSFIGQVAVAGIAEIDARVPPGMHTIEIETMVREIAAEVGGVTVTRIQGWEPNWTNYGGKLGTAWATAARALDVAEQPLAIRLPASDASRWRLLGVPALCFGPQPHLSAGIDDYAEEDEVLRTAALFALASSAFLG